MRSLLVFLSLLAVAHAETRFRYTGLRCRTLIDNGPVASKIDIVVVGDGYTSEMLGAGKKLDRDSRQLVQYLLTVQPFSEYKSSFNLHVVDLESGGSARRGEVEYALGSRLSKNAAIVVDRRAEAWTAAASAPDCDILIIMSTLQGRSHGRFTGKPEVVISTGDSTVLPHELGHSVGHLADEYESETTLYDREAVHLPSGRDVEYPNVTLDKFIDTRNADTIKKTAKWGHFLNFPNAYPTVSAYQGGLYNSVGVWRPSFRCIMRDSNDALFCPVCHEEMSRKLSEMMGKPFDDAEYHRKHPLKLWK